MTSTGTPPSRPRLKRCTGIARVLDVRPPQFVRSPARREAREGVSRRDATPSAVSACRFRSGARRAHTPSRATAAPLALLARRVTCASTRARSSRCASPSSVASYLGGTIARKRRSGNNGRRVRTNARAPPTTTTKTTRDARPKQPQRRGTRDPNNHNDEGRAPQPPTTSDE